MSAASPYDPYRSPTLPEGAYAGVAPTGKPQLLSAVCVICLVLGGLGLMNSVLGATQAALGSKLQQWFQPKAGAGIPPEMQKAQDEFQAEINAVEKRYWTPMIVSLSFRFLAASLLLVGGILALGMKEAGRKLLIAACVIALCFELGHAILQSVVNTEMMTAVNSYVDGMLESMPRGRGGGPPKNIVQTVQTITRVSIMAGLAMFYLLVAIKAGFYLFSFVYLQKPHIQALFADKILPAKLV
jgi:hypothetical protein